MATAETSKKSVWKVIVDKAFKGNAGIKIGRPDCLISAGVPNTAAKVGSLCWDSTNSNAYICTVAAGTWVKINA